ncbi:hypothetical protein D3C85_1795010 [compost metagenome]
MQLGFARTNYSPSEGPMNVSPIPVRHVQKNSRDDRDCTTQFKEKAASFDM